MHDNSCNKTGSEAQGELQAADPSAHLDDGKCCDASYAVWFNSTRALHGEKDSGSTCGGVAFSATSSVSEALNEMGEGGAPITSYRHGARW